MAATSVVEQETANLQAVGAHYLLGMHWGILVKAVVSIVWLQEMVVAFGLQSGVEGPSAAPRESEAECEEIREGA